jgi:hypothetical protein
MSNEIGQHPTVIQDFLSGRREYLDAFDDHVRAYSFLRRLWCRHLEATARRHGNLED